MVTFPLTAVVEEVTRTHTVRSGVVGVMSTDTDPAPGHVVPTVAVTPAGVVPTEAVMRWVSFLPCEVSSRTTVVSAVEPATLVTVTAAGLVAV
jgi:hypothetical protein